MHSTVTESANPFVWMHSCAIAHIAGFISQQNACAAPARIAIMDSKPVPPPMSNTARISTAKGNELTLQMIFELVFCRGVCVCSNLCNLFQASELRHELRCHTLHSLPCRSACENANDPRT